MSEYSLIYRSRVSITDFQLDQPIPYWRFLFDLPIHSSPPPETKEEGERERDVIAWISYTIKIKITISGLIDYRVFLVYWKEYRCFHPRFSGE